MNNKQKACFEEEGENENLNLASVLSLLYQNSKVTTEAQGMVSKMIEASGYSFSKIGTEALFLASMEIARLSYNSLITMPINSYKNIQ